MVIPPVAFHSLLNISSFEIWVVPIVCTGFSPDKKPHTRKIQRKYVLGKADQNFPIFNISTNFHKFLFFYEEIFLNPLIFYNFGGCFWPAVLLGIIPLYSHTFQKAKENYWCVPSPCRSQVPKQIPLPKTRLNLQVSAHMLKSDEHYNRVCLTFSLQKYDWHFY